ncbi:MAG: Ferredoxin [Candidatus Methanohalarchaeum thermophilum]|uniref:Ferredoxin n=1 Tax=Methanohalarchaeum thermophilum TaxID=1903181 RepID=A0A1Q6DV70_METT1|nr:MAG: Ferredoxin [Candidatus Methanohalarchaeum thermophilum]
MNWGVNLVKVKINQTECITCGVCEDVCPEVFKVEETSKIVEEYRVGGEDSEGDVPSDIDCVQNAATQCPVSVIMVD